MNLVLIGLRGAGKTTVMGALLNFVPGGVGLVAADAQDQDDMVDRAGQISFRDGFARAGQRIKA